MRDEGSTSLFDGKTPDGWQTNTGKPLPEKANVQVDGLNPHGLGGYIVVHEKKHGDFVLDFDYKLSAGCNSGVFVQGRLFERPRDDGASICLLQTLRRHALGKD